MSAITANKVVHILQTLENKDTLRANKAQLPRTQHNTSTILLVT